MTSAALPFQTLCAWLVYEFKLTLPEIYRLTPRQVADVYQHPRDEKGTLIPPPAPVPQARREPTDDERLATYLKISEMVKTGHAKLAEGGAEELARRIMELVEKRNARLERERSQHADNR